VVVKATDWDYNQIEWLSLFNGTHPAVMNDRISKINWSFEFDMTKRKTKLKYKVKRLIERYTGVVIGEFRNYKIV
jgi:hypothetical protein